MAEFDDPYMVDTIDFGEVSKGVFLDYFEASCSVDDGMDPAGTVDKAKLWRVRPDNKTTPVILMWQVVNLPGQRRSLLAEHYLQESATEAAGCPTKSEWTAYPQPDVDFNDDEGSPALSDECFNSVMSGITQLLEAGTYSTL